MGSPFFSSRARLRSGHICDVAIYTMLGGTGFLLRHGQHRPLQGRECHPGTWSDTAVGSGLQATFSLKPKIWYRRRKVLKVTLTSSGSSRSLALSQMEPKMEGAASCWRGDTFSAVPSLLETADFASSLPCVFLGVGVGGFPQSRGGCREVSRFLLTSMLTAHSIPAWYPFRGSDPPEKSGR